MRYAITDHYYDKADHGTKFVLQCRNLRPPLAGGYENHKAKAEFLARKAKHHEEQYSVDTKKLTEGRYRLQELDTLIQNIYEDKVLGN